MTRTFQVTPHDILTPNLKNTALGLLDISQIYIVSVTTLCIYQLSFCSTWSKVVHNDRQTIILWDQDGSRFWSQMPQLLSSGCKSSVHGGKPDGTADCLMVLTRHVMCFRKCTFSAFSKDSVGDIVGVIVCCQGKWMHCVWGKMFSTFWWKHFFPHLKNYLNSFFFY